MKVAIVGSRRRHCQDEVYALVDSLKDTDVVVSGGAVGPDSWAVERAKERGLFVKVFHARINRYSRFEVIKSFYERNKKIAEYADVVYAFVSPDRIGGTENTIKWAKKFGKKVVLL